MKGPPSKKDGFRWSPHAVIIIVGIAFSLFLFFIVRQSQRDYLESEFRRMAKNRVLALDRFIQTKISILESVRCFFESSEFVERAEFNTFTASFSEQQEIYNIAWAPHVKHSDRAAFVSRIRAEIPDFSVKQQRSGGDLIPAGEREAYYPVQFIEPDTEQNKMVLGFDVASESPRFQALAAARDNNRAVATETIRLVQDADGKKSFLIFLPVYKSGLPADTLAQRRDNIAGVVIGAFYIETLVDRAMSFTDIEHIRMHLSDISAVGDNRFLYYYAAGDSISPPQNLTPEPHTAGIYTADVIDVGTRQWSILCYPGPALIDLYMNGKAWAILAVGLLLTLLVFFLFLSFWRKTEAIQQLVDMRTEELRRELEQRKRAEKQLAKAAEKLEAKNDELERVIYIASHDMRSPLITISGFDCELQKSCQLLKDLLTEKTPSDNSDSKDAQIRMLLDEAVPESLNFINSGVQKAQMLIDGLLQVSRVGTSPFKTEAINMNELMASVVDIQRFQAKARKADITVGELPDCMADPAKTNQVFSNLIDNALKYLSPDRPGRVIISGIREHDRCIYCVEDNGIGIELEQQSRIFQMFNRACKDPSIKGEGLGLAIVVRILEGQDGEIWVESEPGKGSKFFVSLPSA